MGISLSKSPSTTVQRFNPSKDRAVYTSKDLSRWELDYLAKRHVHAKKAIQEMTSVDIPSDAGVPIISIAIGGRGGARSLPLILGVMQELELRDFLKTVSYTATSGVASCFLVLWHALQAKDMMALQAAIRDLTCERWHLEDISKKDLKRIAFELTKLDRLQLPITLLDIYSVLLSWRVFGSASKHHPPIDARFSDLNRQRLMRKHLTPYPLIDVLSVQKDIPEEIHSNHFEFSPHISGFRSSQCFVDTRVFGMKMDNGKVVGGRRNFYVDVDGYKNACRHQETLGHIMAMSMSSFNDSRWCASVAPKLLRFKKLRKSKRMKHLLNHLCDKDRKRKATGYGIGSPVGGFYSEGANGGSRHHPVPEPNLTSVEPMSPPSTDTPGSPSPASTDAVSLSRNKSHHKSSQKYKSSSTTEGVSSKVEFITDQLKSYNFSAQLWDVKENTNDGRDPSVSRSSNEYTPKNLTSRRFLYFKEPTESLSIPLAPLVRSERVPRILVIMEFSGSHDMIELKKAMAYAALNNRPFPTIDLKSRNFKKPVQIFEPQPHDPPKSPFVVYFQCKTNPVFDKDFDPSNVQENLVSEEQFQQLLLWARFTTKEFYSKIVRLMKRGASVQAQPSMIAGGSFAQSEQLFQRTNSISNSIYSGPSEAQSMSSSRLERGPSVNQVHPLSSGGRRPPSVAAHMNSTRNLDKNSVKQHAKLRKMNTQKQLLKHGSTAKLERSGSRRIKVEAR
uniref:PLA2c domain-containing protein n=1 Tax=Percolomonas cosmopolitus TaxID=63605 RepID=A0A7S1KQV4_9EUKA|mmetsp:Transcript_5692/g.21480  ORF Transcript_5692/g.21480 Transcript_5692/m.21480 type:complete len:730 (+) Transcript_5692:802-2991(+)|eukprot:CAMPEP_0117443238 /NCGR_PEP_ID=MMETSP0759-20121206/4588_1 /TAXON_ID=63605 /ORGANISM="Percolomonas cosmopolitus, Strain WS" /LENGTH=729 /DNA_ID=CAMNT_0005235199 /DNA_START=738 /DNA_END=2927 /DNA_ORIENTATION=+